MRVTLLLSFVLLLLVERGIADCACKDNRALLTAIGYKLTPGIGFHKLHTNAETWNNARKICKSEGAHLAVINSAAEASALLSMLKNASKSIVGAASPTRGLLGIHDLYEEGDWNTLFGASIHSTGYTKWSTGGGVTQPDNWQGNQNCGSLMDDGSGMDDIECFKKWAFFCELPITC